MALSSETKRQLIEKYGGDPKNTGLPEVQIAIFTEEIRNLTKHFQSYPKDHKSKRGLYRIIGKRKRLLKYLQRTSPERYEKIVKELNI